MAKNDTVKLRASRLQQERDELLESALARPGIREMMIVFQDWYEKDQLMEPYRLATRNTHVITTTNSTNKRKINT